MKKISREKDDLLLRYLDGELSPTEAAQVEAELQQEQLSKRLGELQSVNSYLKKKGKLEMPSKNFTQKVMDGLATQAVRKTTSYKRGLFLLIGTVVASGIALALISIGTFDGSVPVVIDSPVNNKILTIPTFSIPFNGKVMVNAIIFLNLILAFVLLDRTILRPLFQRREVVG